MTTRLESIRSRVTPKVLQVHPGVVDAKVGYFGVKLTKVPPGADGHQTC